MGIEIMQVCAHTNEHQIIERTMFRFWMWKCQKTVAFEMYLTWRDPRLQFNHLRISDTDTGKVFGSSNLVPTQKNSWEDYAIWSPTIILFNTRSMLSTSRIDSDESSIVNVLRKGIGRFNSKENLDMVQLFSGSENPLTKVVNTHWV